LLALACAAINTYGVIPMALKAGARSMSEKEEASSERTTRDFVSTGGSATKVSSYNFYSPDRELASHRCCVRLRYDFCTAVSSMDSVIKFLLREVY
jgi:protein subunit release factor A